MRLGGLKDYEGPGMNQVTKNIIAIIVFIASFGLVCFGQSQIGYAGLAMELVGLAGLLILLYLYNRKYK